MFLFHFLKLAWLLTNYEQRIKTTKNSQYEKGTEINLLKPVKSYGLIPTEFILGENAEK